MIWRNESLLNTTLHTKGMAIHPMEEFQFSVVFIKILYEFKILFILKYDQGQNKRKF